MSTNDTAPPGSLRAARAEAGLTRQRLAQLAGCSESYLQLLEGGFNPGDSEVRPRVEEVLREAINDQQRPTGAVGRKTALTVRHVEA
jgi:transcriptional regulator with XRE-family HTH domain